MVGRGNDDGINIGPSEQLAEVDVCGAAGIGPGFALLGVRPMDALDGVLTATTVHVAHRDDLHAWIAEEAGQMSAAHDADADEAEVDASVGPLSLPILRGGGHRE